MVDRCNWPVSTRFSLDFLSHTLTLIEIGGARATRKQRCTQCKSSKNVKAVNLPYVYRYLTNELAGMGIKLQLKLSE
jgi:DNA-directed RNA polymerase beta subunit